MPSGSRETAPKKPPVMRAAARRQEPGAAPALAEQAKHLQLPLPRPLTHTGKSAPRSRQSPRPTLSTRIGQPTSCASRAQTPHGNLAIAGPSGTGKSHFAEALAHQAIDAGMRVAWFTLESLTATIGRAAVDATTAKAIAKITRCDLITIDDIGMLPAGQAAAEALYRLVDAAYERRSLIVTSNLHPSGLDTIMPKTLATATVDRLLHHAHLVLTEGTSLRLAEATAGKTSQGLRCQAAGSA